MPPLPACAPAVGTPPAAVLLPPAERRAILISIDALNEERVRTTLPPAAVPNLLALFDQGACAEHAVPSFPSLTAPAHSALWTGVYGDVSGVMGNNQPRLPRDRHTLLELVSGYSAEVLRAEPIWITAGRAGRTVVGHHVTQAPHSPAYPPVTSEREAELEARRAESRRVLDLPGVQVLNGYNVRLSPHRVLDARSAPLRAASGWMNLERLGLGGAPPRELAFSVGQDSIFGLFYGEQEYSRLLLSPARDAARGVIVLPAPVERERARERALARHFSEPLELRTAQGRAHLVARLFMLAPDGSDFLLYLPEVQVVEGNRPEVAEAYHRVVRGWMGNSALRLYSEGGFGPLLWEGGDGTAEARYLETAEYLARQFMRGAEWAWNEVGADLLLDYFPLGDSVDHEFFGFLDPEWPEYSESIAQQVQAVRARAWDLVDLRLAHLRRLVAQTPGAALFVSGDHGMRATWELFRPNVALQQAGLLALTPEGEIDLALTRALSPNGYWINVNRTAWRGGIVPPAQEAEVLAAAEQALLAVRDGAGRQVVTRTYRPVAHPELGIGGPAGGDLYFGTAPGIRWTWSPRGPVVEPTNPIGMHGFPSTDPDMWTAFCAEGVGFSPRRTGAVRTIDAAPTLAEWLGIPAPADARGRSVLGELQGVPPTSRP